MYSLNNQGENDELDFKAMNTRAEIIECTDRNRNKRVNELEYQGKGKKKKQALQM